MAKLKLLGQMPDQHGKCKCQRCNKLLAEINYYTFKDGSKFTICKPCITAHIDNFNPDTFLWILEKVDVPFVEPEWNSLRDKAFAKDPYKMNGMSVIGKYLSKMKLKQWKDYTYKDTEKIKQDYDKRNEQQRVKEEKERVAYEQQLKKDLSIGKITEAEYKTLVSTETQNKELPKRNANVITGQINVPTAATSYADAISQLKNPFQEQNFLPQSELLDMGSKLTDDDKIYLAMKWGRLYTANQWVTLEQLYTEFMNSFDIQGAARIDTLKKICKTSLKMDQAIDSGDIDSYQKLSRVYDTMMKSAKFTEAQNKDGDGKNIDSASAIVDFVEAHSGQIPRMKIEEPLDIVDKIIFDLKAYTRNLIYDDPSLAQEIEKYLQDKRISEQMKKDKEEAAAKGLDYVPLEDQDMVAYKDTLRHMSEEDKQLTDEKIETSYEKRRVQPK